MEGEAGYALLKMGVYMAREGGYITEYDAVVGEKLAHVLSGGRLTGEQKVSEQYLLDLEREAFLSLCGQREDAGAHAAHAEDRQAAAELGEFTRPTIGGTGRDSFGSQPALRLHRLGSGPLRRPAVTPSTEESSTSGPPAGLKQIFSGGLPRIAASNLASLGGRAAQRDQHGSQRTLDQVEICVHCGEMRARDCGKRIAVPGGHGLRAICREPLCQSP